uniref:DUF1716 domain-containing protein n=2 Tax=Bursaphelenchus xylophilus TaxID=6326 RepID=A0A1I7RYN6_BURXY
MSADPVGSDLKVFPSRLSSVSSENDVMPKHVILAKSELNKTLDAETRKNFGTVLMLVLKWDLEPNLDESSLGFLKACDQLIVENLEISEDFEELKRRVEEDHEDIPELIGAIKNNDFVKKNGTISLLGSFLLTVLEEGAYDSRHRVLLRHTGALLGVKWNDFEDIEDTLVYSLMNQDYVETE